jgi:predicted secreted Zn-dependent protease
VNPKNTWIGFALTDLIVFHVTLAFAAAAWNANIARPSPWLVRAGYHHKGVAMQLVNERINYSPHAASDEVLCAVATLVNVEVCTRGTPD